MKFHFDSHLLWPGALPWAALTLLLIGGWMLLSLRQGGALPVVILRACSAVFLALALLSSGIRRLGPVRDFRLAVVWDGSASMMESDGPALETRWAEARAVWDALRRSVPAGAARHYRLGSGWSSMAETDVAALRPDLGECSFSALGPLVSSCAPRAILLLSDGRSNDEAAAPPGVPIFAVGVGGRGGGPDVAVESVDCPRWVFAGLPVEITARVSAGGLSGPPVQVILLENGRPRARTTVDLSSGPVTVPLVFTPSRPGLALCSVRAEPLPGETRTGNNDRRFAVDVQRDRVRTLYIAGRPGPHYHFLRAQLKNDPSVELVSFVVLRDPEDAMAYSESDLSLIPFPTADALVAQLPTFDLVVLEEMTGLRIGLGRSFYEALDRWVRAGGGFLSVNEAGGSPNIFLGEDVLENLLPWEPGPPALGPERFRLKSLAPGHPLLVLADGPTNDARWANLSALEGSGYFPKGVRPGARALAGEPVGGFPVLAERSLGRGRVVGMANSTSWRWALDGGRRGEGPADYQRFWENGVRWLAGSPGSGPLRLVRPGGPLTPRAPWLVQLRTPPDLARPPRLQVMGPGGRRFPLAVRSSGISGEFAAEFIPPDSGFYELRAEAGESFRDRMWVEAASEWEETRDTRPDFSRLADLARKSGGVFFAAADLREKDWRRWISNLPWEDRSAGGGTEKGWVALALAFLAMEWVVRRRRGLP